ncbi:hypothetical protein PbB2_02831 [Candidatus Phycosocius bacilliformis]|uniref:Uncharacterized protein n=1 Tax=Candidatus Phycosocius bacilliformis TaxID=1445552 RepID=A0A2P2EDJ0_9PROT|nr:hypothetical protein PbB2_02831 [Candidatus Phycosocius bacilliformis]
MKSGLVNFSDLVGLTRHFAAFVLALSPLALCTSAAYAQAQPPSTSKSAVQAPVANSAQPQRSVASLEQEVLMLRERVALLEQRVQNSVRAPLVIDFQNRLPKSGWIYSARGRGHQALDEAVTRWCQTLGYKAGQSLLADEITPQTLIMCFDPPPEQKNQ